MAIVKNGILGSISNKVGTVIGRNFRGQNVITQLYRKSRRHTALRSELKFEWEMIKNFQTHTFHCYMTFSSQNDKLGGNSEYIGLA